MPQQTIRVIINGASGKMGQETVKALNLDSQLELVAALNSKDDLAQAIDKHKAQVVVDFTTPSIVYENCKTIINHNAHPVVGTSGLTPEQISQLQSQCHEKQLGGLIAPNFSIGAILMMQFAQQAAKYLPHVEIIELHHNKKKDAPSGTAIKTAEMIAEQRKSIPEDPTEKETVAGARGGNYQNIHIHSIRLPGVVAHQQVIFGGTGETLNIKHDSIHREAFMPGVVMACKKVVELKELVYGLDKLL